MVMLARLLLLAGVMLAMTTHATIVMAQGAFSGTVTLNGSGTPLSGVDIYVYDGSGNYVGGTRTDGSGVYTVDGLATGSYRAVTYSANSGGSPRKRAFPPSAAIVACPNSRIVPGRTSPPSRCAVICMP